MKKTSVSIMYEDEKLNAVKMYMEQRDLDFKVKPPKPKKPKIESEEKT